jgi:hypothetical protein
MFADGPLYAFELRQTLANAEVRPWLIYGSACEGAREGETSRNYHDGVYGIAGAALSQGVAAYVGPLWKISDVDAKNLAAAFYEALLIRPERGEALALARRSVREGQPDLDELVTMPQRNWFRSGFFARAQYGLGRNGSLRRSDADDPAATQSTGCQGLGPEGAVGTNSSTEYYV